MVPFFDEGKSKFSFSMEREWFLLVNANRIPDAIKKKEIQ